jgi:uracil-DNA glycosylase
MNVNIDETWKEVLKEEFKKPYFNTIVATLKQEKNAGKTIYPAGNLIFEAFNKTPFNKVKIVILGQDPYHGEGQANGLSFSVPESIPIPPSLRNIFKELQYDVFAKEPSHGNLQKWATQGILLLNASLTVEKSKPMSHSKIGWAIFTDHIIELISKEKKGIIFLLWGSFAQEKIKLIDTTKHHVMVAPHPSPLSAYKGFIGCKHFSRTNELLVLQGKQKINWQV